MRDYLVFWTYIGNYAEKPYRVNAACAADAADMFLAFYVPGTSNMDFRRKATIHVYGGREEYATVRNGVVSLPVIREI